MKHIAVLTSGGDAPGMNAAIRAVTRSALDEGMTVSGVLQGWQGMVDGQFRQLSARDVGGIIQVGGTFLGSARSAEFPEESGRSKAPFCPHPACAVMDCLQFNRSHPDSPVEGSGFEPSVPLPRLSSIRTVRAEIIGRSTDVFRRDREFDVSALQRGVSGELGYDVPSP